MDPSRGQPDFNAFGLNNLASSSTQTLNDLFPLNAAFQGLFQNQQFPVPPFQPSPAPSMQQTPFTNPWAAQFAMLNAHTNSPQPNGASQRNSQSVDPPMRYTPPPSTSTPDPAQPINPALNQAWMNSMLQAPMFPGGISPMALNMSLLQQQYMQSAMSAPVGPVDEPLLLTTLLNSRRKNESYKDALNSLHGKSGHSASGWKDYYLDHKDRCDEWIARCLQKEKEDRKAGKVPVKRSASSEAEPAKLPSVKKPSPSHFKRESSPNASALLRGPTSASSRGRPQKRMKPSKSMTPTLPMPLPSRRSTINSITAPEPVFGDRLPPPNYEIKIPEPPSRSPTPPTHIEPGGRGNRYTKEDRDYFIKFIGWRLKHNHDLTRQELCAMLAERAPHHTAQSWASHWSNNHDLPDKILAAARGEEESAMSVDRPSTSASASSSRGGPPVHRKPSYKDASSDEEGMEEEGDDGEGESASGNSSDTSTMSDIRVYTEAEMAPKGTPFNDADLYLTALHIASHPNWHQMSSRERWEPLGVKYPQRSDKSWGEYYRRNKQALLNMAKKIKAAKRKSSRNQCARPSFTLPAKRKVDTRDNDT